MDEPHLSQWKQHGYDKLLGMNHQVLTPPGNMAFFCRKLTIVTSGFYSCFAKWSVKHGIWGYHLVVHPNEMTKVALLVRRKHLQVVKTCRNSAREVWPGRLSLFKGHGYNVTHCTVMCHLIISCNFTHCDLEITCLKGWMILILIFWMYRFPYQTVELPKGKLTHSQLLGGLMKYPQR